MDDAFYMPIELVRAVPIGLDIGTTVAKIVYRAKQDKEYNSNQNQKQCIVRFKSIPIPATDDELSDDVVSFLQEHCDFDTPKKQVPAYVTGIQVGKMEKRFLDQFGIKFEYLKEVDSLANAVVYISKCDLDPADILYPHCEQAIKEGYNSAALLNSLMVVTGNQRDSGSVLEAGLYTINKLQLPCLLMLLGSTAGCIEVLEDGTFDCLEGSFKGGRALQALAKIATGETDFDKIMDMARQGNRRNVDNTFAELLPTTEVSDNPFDATNFGESDLPLHVLGKVLKTDINTIEHNDLLNSFVNMYTAEIAQMSQMAALLHNLPRIYFCGSCVNHALIRERITQEFAMRYGSSFTHRRPPVEFQFLKNGSHLGALGAYVENMKTDKK